MSVFTSETVKVERDADGSGMLIFDVPGRSLNVVTPRLLDDLDAALDALLIARLPVLAVRSGKPTGFLAGADLSSFLSIKDAAAAEALSSRGQAVFDKLAALPTPTVAAVHGPCLGGGLELALACDYRLVLDKPGTQLGLPEVELGLLPAWGGTQRLPRAVGLERALQVILGGRRLNAREAYRWGLSDAYAAGEAQLREQFELLTQRAITRGKRPRTKLPRVTWRQTLLESNPLGRLLIFRGAARMLTRRVPDDMPAPAEALEAVRVGVKQGHEAGERQERQAAGRLALTPACRNLVGLFFAREAARKLPDEGNPKGVVRVGVVGCGVMGAGIAQLAAVKGCEVFVQEVNEEALGAGLLRINSLFGKAVERGVLSAHEASRKLSLVKGGVDWRGFDSVDVAVEAAVEDLAAKRAVFRELEARCRPDAVLATNTSSLRVADIQEGLSRPERVAGLHFFNPVHKMPLVEVARAAATGAATVALLRRWAVALGKTPVVVQDAPGFVVNRVLMPYLSEAVRLVSEGLGVAALDGVMRRFGMAAGPFEVLDQVGLDVAAQVAASMAPLTASRFGPTDAFARLKENGWLGVKSGRGFYVHAGSKAKVNVLAENLLRVGATPPPSARALSSAARLTEARERMVLLMVNEAALALSEGLAEGAEAIDLALVLGSGWAPHRGGPLHYADDRGSPEVVRALEGLAGRYGPRFVPCEELKRRAAEGGRFTASPNPEKS
jgi:3-hydroxyacyl-CoA dehydrogenase/enoyl-CoA hydratase/3-hydroxybutyryl-CoA epimerase